MNYFKTFKPLIALFIIVVLTSLACGSSTNGATVVTPTTGAGETNSNPPVEQPTKEVEQKPLGSSRTNPAPLGSEISSDDMLFSIIEVVRPADEIVAKGNMFNSTPEPEKEFIFVKVKITCQKSADEKCSVTPFTFKLVSSSGNVVDADFMLAGVTGLLETSDLFGGASVEGYLPFIVDKAETNPILMYEPLIIGDPFYLEVAQK